MSEFDDNPFADPFSEPGIQRTVNPTAANQANLLDYDPFAAPVQPAPAAMEPQQPAVMAPTTMDSSQPPMYTPTAQQATAAEFERRQEELERKSEELARREEQLKRASGVQENNWPPLPALCPVGPCFYQDINVEILPEFQRIVRYVYYLWMFHILMLLVNILGSLTLFVSLGGYGSMFGMSLVYAFLFTPLSYVCWFRPVYKAFRSDSSINFMMFFFIFFFQMVIFIAQAVGISSLGTSGWIGVISAFNNHYIGTGIFLVPIACGNTVLAAASVVLLMMVHNVYRTKSTASMNKAQEEFLGGVLRNEHVQNIATNAASSAVRTQFAQNPANNGTPAGNTPRF